MSTGIYSAIIGSVATFLLGLIATLLRRIDLTAKRFMKEHLFLLGIAKWTSKTIPQIAAHLNLTIDQPPEMPNNTRRLP